MVFFVFSLKQLAKAQAGLFPLLDPRDKTTDFPLRFAKTLLCLTTLCYDRNETKADL